MTGFWIGAGALCAVALAFILVPLWRQRRVTGRWSAAGVAFALLTVPLAFGLYVHLRTWQPEVLEQRARQVELVRRLAEEMRENPEEVEGWRLLGRSYVALGEYGAAREAFEEAMRRTPEPDNELKLSLAEAQVLEDQSRLAGEAGEVIEEVLAEEPNNPRALWYGGQRALGLGDEAAARDRLTRLLDLGIVPEGLVPVIRAQLAALGSAAGPQGSGAGEGAAADGPEIKVSVALGDGVSIDGLGPDAALFIFARAPEGGPPVAVIRAPASAVPGEFVLSDRNAMLAGRSLADFEELNLVARVSPSGQALEQPGDLYGERRYRAGDGESVALVIDKVVQ
ncbi:MAG TPA: tetratricopeptide repeat protein [Gammaproteobacteria bacterium]